MESYKKLLTASTLNIVLIIMDIVGLGGIIATVVIAVLQKIDNGFWIAITIILLMTGALIWITLETWMYIKINRSVFELRNYRKVYRCNIDDIDKVELRTDHRGAEFIVIHPKHPIHRQNGRGKIYSDYKDEIVLIRSNKVLSAIKEYIPEEKMPYIKNEHYPRELDL